MGALCSSKCPPREAIGVPRLIAIEDHRGQSENVHRESKIFEATTFMIFGGVPTVAGIYQFEFKIADETTPHGFIVRGIGASVVMVFGQVFFVCFLRMVE